MVDRLEIEPGTRGFGVAPRLMLQAVTFEFDSADLTPAATGILERVAGALTSPRLEGVRFLIEGHTDAVGEHSYNQHLSTRRAAAVKAFLGGLGVATARMEVAGRGEDQLLEDEPPDSPQHRRVEIVRLAGER